MAAVVDQVPAKPTIYVCATQAAAEKLMESIPDTSAIAHTTDADTMIACANAQPYLIPDNTQESRAIMSKLASTFVNCGVPAYVANLNGLAINWQLEDQLANGMTDTEFSAIPFKLLQPNVVQLAEKKVRQPPRRNHSESALDLWNKYGLFIDRGTPIDNIDNALRAMSGAQMPFWFDEFLQRAITEWNTERREWRDSDYVELTLWFQQTLEMRKMSLRTVTAAVDAYFRRNTRNCAQEWLRGLTWDGTARLDMLAVDGFGTPADAYHAAVLRCFVMSLCARILTPGCQVDSMPVFEGPEGIRKSSALRILGGHWFAECHEQITTKDFLQIMPGKALLEISELYSFKRAEIERIKGIITNRVDRYRASYGRTAGDYPRMCVFAGTTNRDDWNSSDTGARRFWPVVCGIIDLDWIRMHREQLFAEAVARLDQGEPYWNVPTDDAKAAVDARRAADPWEHAIRYYAQQRPSVSVDEILQQCLSFDLNKVDQGAAGRVRSCLRLIGWKSFVSSREGVSMRLWKPATSYADQRIAALKADQQPKPVPVSEPETMPAEPDPFAGVPF